MSEIESGLTGNIEVANDNIEKVENNDNNEQRGTYITETDDKQGIAKKDGVNDTIIIEKLQNGEIKYPDYLDATTYDLKEKKLIEAGVVSKFKELEETKKRADGLRRILSEKGAPENDGDYIAEYKADSRFEKFIETEEGKTVLNELKDIAKENGFTKKQYQASVDYVNNKLEKLGIVNTMSAVEMEAKRQEWIVEQKKLLGDNADAIIKSNVDFITNNGFFNTVEKKELMRICDSGAIGISVVSKIKKALTYDKVGTPEIPITANSQLGMPDINTLKRQYKNATAEQAQELFNIYMKGVEKGIYQRGGLV
ncbi:MAG: hypothetical protein LBC92_00380 [Rickettsiales bacterium]|jgi:hypothetical protein|nr:hypothetical protein [Rickettsiales bacterium]